MYRYCCVFYFSVQLSFEALSRYRGKATSINIMCVLSLVLYDGLLIELSSIDELYPEDGGSKLSDTSVPASLQGVIFRMT
jgi:hypothetical protein